MLENNELQFMKTTFQFLLDLNLVEWTSPWWTHSILEAHSSESQGQ